jgi:hypothetical protein
MQLKNIHPWFLGLSLAWRLAVVGGIVLLTVLLADWLFFRPARLAADNVTIKAGATVAKGEVAKAADAAKIVENTHEIVRTIERQTIVNERTIRAAPDAGQLVAPGVDRAGRAALCMRHAYRDHPSCQQLPGAGAALDHGADPGG